MEEDEEEQDGSLMAWLFKQASKQALFIMFLLGLRLPAFWSVVVVVVVGRQTKHWLYFISILAMNAILHIT